MLAAAAPLRDSCGFPLASLTAEEAAARARCLSSASAASLAKAWAASGDVVDAFAAAPTSAPPKKLKALARAGIPAALRPALWFRLSGGAALAAAAGPDAYDSLVKEADVAASPKSVISRADLELFNPFPLHPLLSSVKGMRATRRVVLAHARHCGRVEFAQGVSSVAAFLLAVMGMGQEEQAFWTLCALTTHRLHPAFFEELRGCRVEQRTLEELARRKVPRVPALFDQLEAPLGELTADWMCYLFTRSLPAESAARVFDCLLVEGSKALHRAGLALFKVHEAALVSTCKGSLKLGQVLKWRVARTYDTDLLMKVAYALSLQGSTISQLRAVHEAALAADHSALATRLMSFVRASPPGPAAGAGGGAFLPASRSASTSSISSGTAAAAAAGEAAALLPAPRPTAFGTAAGVSAAMGAPPRAVLPGGVRQHNSPPEMLRVASLRLLVAGGR